MPRPGDLLLRRDQRAREEKHPPAPRVSACAVLLERGWGKARQEITGEDGKDIRITIRKMTEPDPDEERSAKQEVSIGRANPDRGVIAVFASPVRSPREAGVWLLRRKWRTSDLLCASIMNLEMQ